MSGQAPELDLDPLVDDPAVRIVVCCGSGGVGKTTTAAALGLRAAERGRRVVVLTIDPARRLAQSMGVGELDNTPREVTDVDTSAGGSLHAMMLDMKSTFDEVVLTHAEPDRAEAILANPFYQSLSSSMAGTQEYMAMERLGQLRRTGDWDLIVVDTPPSRSALDFLDAPKRLGSFLDGRVIRVLSGPAKAGGRTYLRALTTGMGLVTNVLTKVLGAHLLRDVQAFISALDTMFGGFRERADATYRLLKDPETRFVVVAAPEPDALREASFFVERLTVEKMPLAGLVLNRVHRPAVTGLSAGRSLTAAEDLEGGATRDGAPRDGATRDGAPRDGATRDGATLTSGLLRLHAERMTLAAREGRLTERFTSAHPNVAVGQVPAQPGDVCDLEGLRRVGADLGSSAGPARSLR